MLRDFRIRYRNMSLGVFWSALNPLVLMGVLTFVFTKIFPTGPKTNYHLSVLAGLVVFNFFSLGWSTATMSIINNAPLIKRVPMAREVIPISTVFANTLDFVVQLALLLGFCAASGLVPNSAWTWLPLVVALEVALVCGLSLVTSALDVYFRDIRYIVQSFIMLMFWLVPIFYDHSMIPEQYHWVYWYNPVAAVVLSMRNILLESRMEMGTLAKLAVMSLSCLAFGFWFFGKMKRRFADYM